jgi:hypothetical protein
VNKAFAIFPQDGREKCCTRMTGIAPRLVQVNSVAGRDSGKGSGMMRVWALGLLAVALGWAGGAGAEYRFPEPQFGDACALFTPDATYVTLAIEMDLEGREVQIRVPTDYFEDRLNPAKIQRTTSKLFSVEIGTFLPVTRPQTAEKHKAGLMDYMAFLVGDVVDLKQIALNRIEQYKVREKKPLAEYIAKPIDFGLYDVEMDHPYLQDEFAYNVYLDARPDEEFSAVISCDAPGTVLSPGCDHFFVAENLDVDVHYNRNYLPYWKEIQGSMSDFLKCSTPKTEVQ